MLIDEIRNIKSSKKELRNFGLTVGIALWILGGLLFWVGRELYPYLLIFGITIILFGLVVPNLLKPIQKFWMTVAVILGWFMTRLILSVLFYVVFTPISLIGKLFGKQFIELKWDKSKQSYWNYREPKEFDRNEYERQF